MFPELLLCAPHYTKSKQTNNNKNPGPVLEELSVYSRDGQEFSLLLPTQSPGVS